MDRKVYVTCVVDGGVVQQLTFPSIARTAQWLFEQHHRIHCDKTHCVHNFHHSLETVRVVTIVITTEDPHERDEAEDEYLRRATDEDRSDPPAVG